MGSYEYSPKYISLAELRNLLSHRIKLSLTDKKLYHSKPIKRLERLRRRGLDLNYAVPSDAPITQCDRPDFAGCTTLHFAVEAFDKLIINYLIENGAKNTTINELGYSPVRLALQKLFDYPEKWFFLKKENSRASYFVSKLQSNIHVLNMLLTGQYNQNDASNPSCKDGISHLHIACMVDNARMVEFLLRSGASPDVAISQDLSEIAGFRPLHLAVYYRSTDSLKVLLKGGADICAREALGLNPLQLLIDGNLMLADIATIQVLHNLDVSLEEYYLANDEMATSMLEHCAENFDDECEFGWLHLAASMRDDTMLADLLKNNPGINLNAAISSSSLQCYGYTPLHFAARCGPNTVKLLVEKGANLLIADAQDTTPFDICVNRYKPEIIFEIMQLDETLKNITFKASPLATLSEAINALRNIKCMDEFQRKMNHIDDPLPSDSPLWPGYNLLHLVVAVRLQEYELYYKENVIYDHLGKGQLVAMQDQKVQEDDFMLRYLIQIGANPLAQDVLNSSPVHLAFRRSCTNAVKHLLQQVVKKFKRFDNVTDLDGLSLLHISAAGSFNDVAVSLLKNNADVNIRTISRIKFMWNNVEYDFPPGSTPLHFAAATNSSAINLLIRKGANYVAVDADGFTPILRYFIWKVSNPKIKLHEADNALLKKMSTSKTNAVSVAGLSHLHVACRWNWTTSVKAFIKKGAYVNAEIINCDLNDSNSKCTRTQYFKDSVFKKYAGYTPLHFAVEFKSYDTISLLMKSGADLHARNAEGLSPLHMALKRDSKRAKKVIQCLVANVDKLNCKPLDDYGITLLHVACRIRNKKWTRKLLLRGADANVQIAVHSPIWPGDTPLHVLIDMLIILKLKFCSKEELLLKIMRLLMEHGADINLSKVKGNTPIYDLIKYLVRYLLRVSDPLHNYWRNYLKNYLQNLQYCNGNLPHKDVYPPLYLACKSDDRIEIGSNNEMEIVTELLSYGADINQPVDYFVDCEGGNRPVHIAVIHRRSDLFQLLIEKGADPSVEDANGRTVFHYLFEDVNIGFRYSYVLPMIQTFCKHGLDINAHDVTGSSPLQILLKYYHSQFRRAEGEYEKIVAYILKCGARLNSLDSMMSDPTMLYLVGANIRGLSVDFLRNANDTDILAVMDDGSTAIHNAVRGYIVSFYDNENLEIPDVIKVLLKRGCSINAQDNHGRTALHVALDYENINGVKILLAAGIDINIVDDDGKNHWEVANRSDKISNILGNHLHKLTLLGLEMSELNRRQYLALHHLVSSLLNRKQKKLSSLNRDSEESSSLDKDNEELASLHSDNEESSSLDKDSEELASLESDNEESFLWDRDIEELTSLDSDSEKSFSLDREIEELASLHSDNEELSSLDRYSEELNSLVGDNEESSSLDRDIEELASFFSSDSGKEELKLIKELEEPIGGFLLSEILSERIFSKYSEMSRVNRGDFLHKLADPELRRMFHYFREPIQYQYQRLLERMNLVELSIGVLQILLGKFLPEPCLDRILGFLSNAELRILIRGGQSLQL